VILDEAAERARMLSIHRMMAMENDGGNAGGKLGEESCLRARLGGAAFE
jgi:hypothetical protein